MKKTFLLSLILATLFIGGCSKDDVSLTRSFEEQLAIDKEIIDKHLLEKNIKAEEHESGIRFITNKEGTGKKPEIGDDIIVKYKSFFLDDRHLSRDTIGISLILEKPIISAWILMLPNIKEGGKITIYAPSGYTFGSSDNIINIPPNTILIYEIELLGIVDNPAKRLSLEGDIIDELLLEKKIEAQTHSSGIRYTVIEEGNGDEDTPTTDDSVLVKYIGTFLSGIVFDSNDTGIVFSLSDIIPAWKTMIPTMKEGGKIKFYAPSKYCYGTTGIQGIPSNTILAFEVELISIQE